LEALASFLAQSRHRIGKRRRGGNMEACDTAGIMDAITAVTGVLTLLVAWAALFSWRRQERQKAILAWKADLVDYAYGFPNLPVIWGYQTHKDEVDQAAERFYRCVKSYMVMRELVSRKRMKAYERIWRQAHFVHEKCTFEGQMTCAIARDLLSQAYLNDFLKS